jgi:hypothetical protein
MKQGSVNLSGVDEGCKLSGDDSLFEDIRLNLKNHIAAIIPDETQNPTM